MDRYDLELRDTCQRLQDELLDAIKNTPATTDATGLIGSAGELAVVLGPHARATRTDYLNAIDAARSALENARTAAPGDGATEAAVAIPSVHRCSKRQGRPDLPPLCRTCQRIDVEWAIVTRTVDALLAAGYLLQTDLQEDPRPEKPTADCAAILAEMMDVDDEFLGAFVADDTTLPVGWVRFVYGNSGYDVISDYTTNLEHVLAPVMAYAETLEV